MDDGQSTKQLMAIFLEIKELKHLKSISGDMDLSDEIRKVNDLLTDLSYNWNMGIEVIFKIWGYYTLHSNMPIKQKEKKWNIIATFLRALGQLCTHSDYIQTSQIFFEQLRTDIEQKERTM